jgi:hypothetical protein
MTLRKIHAGCDELIAITNDEWLIMTEKEQEAIRQRIVTIQHDIRDAARKHNDAVLRVVRGHHPEEPKIKPDDIEDLVEHLNADWERIELPSEKTCAEPLQEDPIEEVLAALPPEIRHAHRFGVLVRNQVGTLMGEASMVHERNRRGEHLQRVHPPHAENRPDSPEHVLGHS